MTMIKRLVLLSSALIIPGTLFTSAPAQTVTTTGQVTPGTIPKFASPTRITDSVITESSGDIAIGLGEPQTRLTVSGQAPGDKGIFGISADGVGVAGKSDSSNGTSGQSMTGNGVFGVVITSGTGVWGETTSGFGVYGQSGSVPSPVVSNIGVFGQSDGDGVVGLSSQHEGVFGGSTTALGVFGFSNSGVAVYGESFGNDGVVGLSFSDSFAGVTGTSDAGIGVHGKSNSGKAIYGESASGFAGDFKGNVRVLGTLSKAAGSFTIDHPLDPANKTLSHSFVESPEMMNIYDGNVVTDEEGNATITLPAYFQSLNRDFVYQLTPIGQFAQVIVSNEIKDNRFTIKTDKPRIKVSWMVTGVRQDAYANAHRITVEEDKPMTQRGRYLFPELYGQPNVNGIIPRLAERRDD